jgi:L-malate glycosyltransferase
VKILQIVSGREVNGALVYAKLLAEQLQGRGHQVTLMVRPESWMCKQLVSVPLVHSHMNRFPPSELMRTARMIREKKFDVVHTHMSRAHHFGMLLKFLTRVATIATCHAPRLHPHWHFHDLVIANSHATLQHLQNVVRLPKDRLETIHCFVDLENFLHVESRNRVFYRRVLHLRDDEFLIGVVGGVLQRKGQDVLVRALPQILKAIPTAKVAFIGRFHRREAYVQKMRGFQLKHNLLRKVKWLGIRNNVNEYLQAFDLTVIPSNQEPLGLVAIESQAAGVPVVATTAGGLPEIISDHRTGWLVPTNDPRALADAIIHAARNPHQRSEIAASARQTVQENFSPALLTSKVEQAYERILGKRLQRFPHAA